MNKNIDVIEYDLDDNVLLEVENLSMSFGGLKAVNKLSFNIKKDEIVGLIGPNGAGKTTVFNCITQFYKDKEGTILFRNKNQDIVNLNNIHVEKVIKEGLVRTFQNVELINQIFRIAHTIKGSAGFAGLDEMSKIGRKMEDIFGDVRKGNTSISSSLLSHEEMSPIARKRAPRVVRVMFLIKSL